MPSTFSRTIAVVSVGAVLVTLAGSVQAAPRRVALLVGDNTGEGYDVALRYAESETRRLGEVLRSLGDFDAADVLTLAHPRADELRQAFATVRARLRAAGGDTMLFVFYSGHADAEGLHLAGERFPLDELRDLVADIPATARVLVVDACRSGALTRVKGGAPGPSFEVHLTAPITARGMAILTSSAAGEDAQESDEIGSSLFTHFLTSALIGAGDKNDDGAVTVEEAFAYASENTIAATSATRMGPQHPTFRYDLGGRGALVLTHPGRPNQRLGHFRFVEPGWYLVRGSDGPVIAELQATRAGQMLALAAGRYRLTERRRDRYLEGELMVRAGETALVTPALLRPHAYESVASKGGRALFEAAPDGGVARKPPLWKRWWFWTVASAGVAAIAGGVTAGVLASRRQETTFQIWQP